MATSSKPTIVNDKKPIKLSLVATIIGAVGFFLALIPYVGIVLGLIAIVLSLIARKKSGSRVTWIAGLTLGILSLVAGLFLTLILSLLFSGPLTGIGERNQAREAALQQIEERGTTFTSDETALITAYNVEVLSVERDLPRPEGERLNDDPAEIIDNGQEYPRGDVVEIPEAEAEYVRVVLRITPSGEEDLERLFESVNFSALELNNTRFFERESGRVEGIEEPTEVSLLYRIRQSDELQLTLTESVFTKELFIVGTEGAPRQLITYTINIVE